MDQELIKKKLIREYIFLMLLFLTIYGGFYSIISLNKYIVFYTLGGLFLLLCGILFTNRNYDVKTAVHCWLIIAPLYLSIYFIAFWNYSIISYVWLLPIPLVANIFFSNKIMFRYTLGLLLYMVIIIIIAEKINYQDIYITRRQLIFSDALVIICNISVFIILIYYMDILKVNNLPQNGQDSKQKQEIQVKNSKESELERHKNLFKTISTFMENNEPFKKSDFTISNLATLIQSNNTYIYQAIKSEGYTNFNNYLNSYRVKYVKELMNEEKSKAYTLLYVYTEAGFTSQSTFNRVFKQFEGISPSQFIKNNSSKKNI